MLGDHGRTKAVLTCEASTIDLVCVCVFASVSSPACHSAFIFSCIKKPQKQLSFYLWFSPKLKIALVLVYVCFDAIAEICVMMLLFVVCGPPKQVL